MINIINDVLICACATMITIFCVFYHLSARWWNSREGQRVMLSMIVIAAVLDLTIAKMIVGQLPVLRLVSAVVFGVGLVMSCSWVYLLYVVQIKGEPLTERMRRRVNARHRAVGNVVDVSERDAGQRGSGSRPGDDPPLHDALPGTSGPG